MARNQASSLKAIQTSKKIAWKIYSFICYMDQTVITDSSDFSRSMDFYNKNIDRMTKYSQWVESINKKYGFEEESFSSDLSTLLSDNHLI